MNVAALVRNVVGSGFRIDGNPSVVYLGNAHQRRVARRADEREIRTLDGSGEQVTKTWTVNLRGHITAQYPKQPPLGRAGESGNQ